MNTYLQELSNELRSVFTSPNAPRIVNAEQFFRNYISENPPKNMVEEDDFVEEYLEKFIDNLAKYDWLRVDKESQVLINESVNITAPKKSDFRKQSKKELFIRLDELNQKEKLNIEDLEFIKSALLSGESDYHRAEELSYKAAVNAGALSSYTEDDKAEFWVGAAKLSLSKAKKMECYERAADLKSKVFKYEDATNYIGRCILLIDKRFKKEDINLLIKIKNRCSIMFSSKDESNEHLLRLCRKYRLLAEQAGLRDQASLGFVYEYDALMQRQFWFRPLSWSYWLFARYGESPVRVFLFSILLIFGWAWVYQCIGIQYNLEGDKPNISDFFLNVYFSMVTFTTLGYGDFSPIGNGRMVASIQALTGLFMTSLFLVTFVRRFSR